jgi:type III secretion apparatus needle protein
MIGGLSNLLDPSKLLGNLTQALNPMGIGGGMINDVFKPLTGLGENLFGFADKLLDFIPGGGQTPGAGGFGGLPGMQMPTPFQPGQTLDQLGGKLNQSFGNMNNAMSNVDPNDPQSMINAQKAMNQYEQTMQLMTTMMKMLHDINMAIIRNLH